VSLQLRHLSRQRRLICPVGGDRAAVSVEPRLDRKAEVPPRINVVSSFTADTTLSARKSA